MDIEEDTNNQQKNSNQSGNKSPNKLSIQPNRQSVEGKISMNHRQSFQSRRSNQSFFSIGRMSLQQQNAYENQKISLESDISLKARNMFQNVDLFENLARDKQQCQNPLYIREESSLKQNNDYVDNKITSNSYPGLHHYSSDNNPFSLSVHLNLNPNQFKHRNSEGTYDHGNNLSSYNSYSSFSAQNQTQNNLQAKRQNYTQKIEEKKMEVQQKQEKTISCKCPRSKCLLMYCQCFSKGILCNPSCSCYQCRNNHDFEQKRQNARKIVLQRDPNAFSNKLEVVGGQESQQLGYKRGCNCKKTNCFKKYCQCFCAGVKCTYLCNCQNCMNGGENAYKG